MLGKGTVVIGWRLDPQEREALLLRFPPAYEHPIADHVTLQADASADTPLPSAVKGEIVGRTDDRRGVQAMVMRIDGTSNRPGGGFYHVTWSLAEGRRAVESNDVIAERGWESLDRPIPITLTPARF